MLIKVDAKQLEWRAALELSRDAVGIQEVFDNVDQHEINRARFKLPTRLIAKTFLFRLIYGGSAYAFTKDFNFSWVSSDTAYWQRVIDATYNKYADLARWHEAIVHTVSTTGRLSIPTGRIYRYDLEHDYKGIAYWPRPKILNYPVQGFSADLMQIARISAYNRLKGQCLFINTVHDDIQLDVDNNPELLYNISITLENVFKDITKNVKLIYGYDMVVPMAGEVSFGWNLLNLTEFDSNKGKEQFECLLK